MTSLCAQEYVRDTVDITGPFTVDGSKIRFSKNDKFNDQSQKV